MYSYHVEVQNFWLIITNVEPILTNDELDTMKFCEIYIKILVWIKYI